MTKPARWVPRGPAIENLASAVTDNGRRGAPLAGCDCLQCFGYCMIDREVAERTRFEREPVKRDTAPVDEVIA